MRLQAAGDGRTTLQAATCRGPARAAHAFALTAAAESSTGLQFNAGFARRAEAAASGRTAAAATGQQGRGNLPPATPAPECRQAGRSTHRESHAEAAAACKQQAQGEGGGSLDDGSRDGSSPGSAGLCARGSHRSSRSQAACGAGCTESASSHALQAPQQQEEGWAAFQGCRHPAVRLQAGTSWGPTSKPHTGSLAMWAGLVHRTPAWICSISAGGIPRQCGPPSTPTSPPLASTLLPCLDTPCASRCR